MPKYHPSDALLLAYASGGLDEGQSLAVATHLQLCPACRRRLRMMEALGGAMLETLPPEPISSDCFSRIISRLAEPAAAPPPKRSTNDDEIPSPLRSYIETRSGTWQDACDTVGREIDIQAGDTSIRLLRLAAGAELPKHSHADGEVAVVLSGGFSDQSGQFERGDLIEIDAGTTHGQNACPKRGCLCLIVNVTPDISDPENVPVSPAA